ncbi:hypothetical protein H9S92_09610 [Lewinella lacunae]|uniref:Uncharacterized protein n=1 Tax=Neolewinella lacunae TaxID=1517758 RepID=A0A923T7E6_9BACT|nr:hypothetical protein [Neolewinella lacunae]MBC6994420.1 hypothetical protein [Neolewinella lacunae]
MIRLLEGNSTVAAEDSKIRKLYDLILEEQKTEEEIVQVLYGKGRLPTLGKYKTLKTRLRHILVQCFLMEQPKEPSYLTYDQAYHFGYQQLAAGRMLAGKGAHNAARKVLLLTLQYVKDYEIIHLNHGLTEMLAGLHLGTAYSEDLFQRYLQLAAYYSEAAYDLDLLNNRYRQVRNSIYSQRSSPMDIGIMAAKFVAECAHLPAKYPNISLLQGIFAILEITSFMQQGLYEKAIEASLRGTAALERCKGASHSTLSMLALSRVECTIKLGDYQRGLEQIELARKTISKNSINELKLTEYAIQLGLRTGNYDLAYLELAQLNRPKLKSLILERHIEYWQILEAYVNVLFLAGKITPQEDWPELPKFKMRKFVNNVPAYSKNKKGMNTQVLITHILFLLVQKEYDEVTERIEALANYCKRYLREDENLRNNCFFKLLSIASQSSFFRQLADQKGRKTLERMQNAKEYASNKDAEIVPYEHLWEIILNQLTGPGVHQQN